MGHARGGGLAQAAMRCGPRWAPARAFGGEAGWVGPLARPNPVGWIFFFFEFIFLMRKQIPEKSRNCLKARKIFQKSQKFQENS
jgi:hypothetical protein